MKSRHVATVIIALLLGAPACASSDAPRGAPHATGSSSSGAGGGAGGGGGGSAGGGGSGIDPRFEPLAEAIEAERIRLGAPGVAVAVVEGGEVTFAAGFGSKDPTADVPVAPTTLFRIGSVQKMLTATALLQQVAAGAVALDDPITDHVPAFDLAADPAWAPTIRIEQLLTHSSGLVDYLEIDAPLVQQQDSALESFLLNNFGNIGYLMVPAGSFYNYSNPGFYLAGWITEKTSGESYRDYMKAHVFQPLGMTRTFYLASEVFGDGDYALGKTSYPDLPEVIAPDTYENAWARPAGYAFSSVLDLAKFVAFLDQGNVAVLPADLHQAMQSPQIDTRDFLDVIHYGYGLGVSTGTFFADDDFRKLDLVSHGGAIPGFSAEITWARSMDIALVFLANADGAHFSDSVVTALETLGTPPEPSPLPDLTPDAATLAACAGDYHDPFNVGDIFVTVDAGGLRVDMPAVDAAGIPYDPVLVAIDPRNYILMVQGVPLQVTFLDDDLGVTRWLRTRVFVGIRPDAPSMANLVTTPRVDKQSFMRKLVAAADAAVVRPIVPGPLR